MRVAMGFLVVSLNLLFFTASAFANHSFAAQYDPAKLMQFAGTVTKVEWTNPHARFYVDVKDAQGTLTNWNFELGPPLVLRRLGWKQDSLRIGGQVSVEGYLARDGSKMSNAKKVTLPDGSNVFAGSSAEGSSTSVVSHK